MKVLLRENKSVKAGTDQGKDLGLSSAFVEAS